MLTGWHLLVIIAVIAVVFGALVIGGIIVGVVLLRKAATQHTTDQATNAGP